MFSSILSILLFPVNSVNEITTFSDLRSAYSFPLLVRSPFMFLDTSAVAEELEPIANLARIVSATHLQSTSLFIIRW